MAVMDRISLEQLWLQLAISILASCGSRGNSTITAPRCNSKPSDYHRFAYKHFTDCISQLTSPLNPLNDLFRINQRIRSTYNRDDGLVAFLRFRCVGNIPINKCSVDKSI
jgi:hypothetical protein